MCPAAKSRRHTQSCEAHTDYGHRRSSLHQRIPPASLCVRHRSSKLLLLRFLFCLLRFLCHGVVPLLKDRTLSREPIRTKSVPRVRGQSTPNGCSIHKFSPKRRLRAERGSTDAATRPRHSSLKIFRHIAEPLQYNRVRKLANVRIACTLECDRPRIGRIA